MGRGGFDVMMVTRRSVGRRARTREKIRDCLAVFGVASSSDKLCPRPWMVGIVKPTR